MSDRPLSGRRVVVTRAADRAAPLREALVALGAVVKEIAVTETRDIENSDLELRKALESDGLSWIVVTSPEGASRVAGVLRRTNLAATVQFAAVGRATAAALGREVHLVPDVQTGSSLGSAFPNGSGRVVLAVAEAAGDDFASAAREKGWQVDRINLYRTAAIRPSDSTTTNMDEFDAVTFTATSAVRSWFDVYGASAPSVVVAIGPSTARALHDLGFTGVRVADHQSIDGLVAKVVEVLR